MRARRRAVRLGRRYGDGRAAQRRALRSVVRRADAGRSLRTLAAGPGHVPARERGDRDPRARAAWRRFAPGARADRRGLRAAGDSRAHGVLSLAPERRVRRRAQCRQDGPPRRSAAGGLSRPALLVRHCDRSRRKTSPAILRPFVGLPATFTFTGFFGIPGRTAIRPQRLASIAEELGIWGRAIGDPVDAFSIARRNADAADDRGRYGFDVRRRDAARVVDSQRRELECLNLRPAARLRVRGQSLPWGRRTYVMGIVNVSPDSFSGDGAPDSATAVARALEQRDAGVRHHRRRRRIDASRLRADRCRDGDGAAAAGRRSVARRATRDRSSRSTPSNPTSIAARTRPAATCSIRSGARPTR